MLLADQWEERNCFSRVSDHWQERERTGSCQVKQASPPSHSRSSRLCCHARPSLLGSFISCRRPAPWERACDREHIIFSFWTAHLFDQGAEVEGGEGRLFGRLHDDGVATAQGRRQLPHQHQQREVPLQQGTGERGGPGPTRYPAPWRALALGLNG